MSARTPQRQQLMELLEPVITLQGYDLEDLTVTAAGRRSVIRVTVDSDDGIDLDAVAEVARAVSAVLDPDPVEGPSSAQPNPVFAGPFVLEVSSPGVDRPLTEPRHWRRAVGRLVTTTLLGADTPGFEVTGRVLETDPSGVSLEVADQPNKASTPNKASASKKAEKVEQVEQVNGIVRYGWSQLGPGRIQVEFSRPGVSFEDDELDEVPTPPTKEA